MTFSLSASTSFVGGALLGMSKTVVTPPAAAAAVPLRKPSLYVAPGSRMWTWTSITPGRTKRPEASITFEAFGALEFEPSHATFPSFEAIAHLRRDDETATTPFLITRSAELKIGWGSERRSSVFIA